ncbi:hypothetical protein JTE90_022874 [Oedothorax gibbosus]|uniref:methenyltetrahydrofolate cyclohydrolase n=1 Tax=Oedothorax gibbosus TaxID=931172 RepID=A0AAV6URF0_9ARAC|nr:hypothetical protein JTE90_022874 [Oedothorax gibbosus]
MYVYVILFQLPLDTDTPVDENLILNAVSPNKDVDGLCDANAGRLSHGELEGFFVPCTPTGCMQLIKKTGVTIKGSKAVVIGSSKTVGLPMSLLLLWHHATVVTCHSTTKDLKDETIPVLPVGGQWVMLDTEDVKEVASWITPVPGSRLPSEVRSSILPSFADGQHAGLRMYIPYAQKTYGRFINLYLSI